MKLKKKTITVTEQLKTCRSHARQLTGKMGTQTHVPKKGPGSYKRQKSVKFDE